MIKEPLIEGKFTFYILRKPQRNQSEVEQFLSTLKRQRPNDYKKVSTKLLSWAQLGCIPNNRENFVHEEGKIYAIKSHQIRLYGFYEGNSGFILTNGDVKRQDNANQTCLDKAENYRIRYLESRR